MNSQTTKLKPSLQEQELFYDKYWESLGPYSSRKVARISKIMEYLTKIRKTISKPEILDLGCGDGRSVAIWNLFGTATGLDLSEKAIQNARKLFPGINFTNGDAVNTSFPDERFDIVISHEVIEHLENQTAYINECARLLKKGGYIVLTTPNKYYFDHFKKGNYSKQPIENIINIQTLRSLLKDRFHIIEEDSVVAGIAEKGIYKLLTNKYIIGLFRKTKLEFIRIHIIQKQFLGVHLCILARRKQ